MLVGFIDCSWILLLVAPSWDGEGRLIVSVNILLISALHFIVCPLARVAATASHGFLEVVRELRIGIGVLFGSLDVESILVEGISGTWVILLKFLPSGHTIGLCAATLSVNVVATANANPDLVLQKR